MNARGRTVETILGSPRRRLGGYIRRQLFAEGRTDYTQPPGDPGVFGPETVTWKVHANPVSLAIGGIAAVILELAEPRVRTGVWEHSTPHRSAGPHAAHRRRDDADHLRAHRGG